MGNHQLYAQGHQEAGDALVLAPQGLGIPRHPPWVHLDGSASVGGRGGLGGAGLQQDWQSLDYLLANELLSCALEVQNF